MKDGAEELFPSGKYVQVLAWLTPEDADKNRQRPGMGIDATLVLDGMDKAPIAQRNVHVIFNNTCGFTAVSELSPQTLFTPTDYRDFDALPERARSLLQSTA